MVWGSIPCLTTKRVGLVTLNLCKWDNISLAAYSSPPWSLGIDSYRRNQILQIQTYKSGDLDGLFQIFWREYWYCKYDIEKKLLSFAYETLGKCAFNLVTFLFLRKVRRCLPSLRPSIWRALKIYLWTLYNGPRWPTQNWYAPFAPWVDSKTSVGQEPWSQQAKN